jgi:hypothetical protein
MHRARECDDIGRPSLGRPFALGCIAIAFHTTAVAARPAFAAGEIVVARLTLTRKRDVGDRFCASAL